MNHSISCYLSFLLVLILASIAISGCPTGSDEGEPEAEPEGEALAEPEGEGVTEPPGDEGEAEPPVEGQPSTEGESEGEGELYEGEEEPEGEAEPPTDEGEAEPSAEGQPSTEGESEGEAEPPEEGQPSTEGDPQGEGEWYEGEEELEGEAETPPHEGESEPDAGDTETVILPGGVPLEMAWIPAGTFMMGASEAEPEAALEGEYHPYVDEYPRHQVTLTQDFWLGKYEVTLAQWESVMGPREGEWEGEGTIYDDPNRSAVGMTWEEIPAFVAALNSATGLSFRLPSEAEWEYACRAGTITRFYWGDDPDQTVIDDYAWWMGNSPGILEEYPHLVGQLLPNAWGLYDMSGNVEEWCQDWYGDYPSVPVTDPEGPTTGSFHVQRGGTSSSSGPYCRSSSRGATEPYDASEGFGFRLAR